MGFLSVLAQAGYLTLVQKAAQQQQLEQKQQQQQQDQQGQSDKQTSTASAAASSTIQMLYVNGYNTLPVFVVACVVFGEPLQIIKSQHLSGKCSFTLRDETM